MGFLPFTQRFLSRHWGIHPADDGKRPAADRPVRVMPPPARLVLPLQQHLGAPARPLVQVGQAVRKGELLAVAEGAVSAPVHASTSGVVVAFAEITAPHLSGLSTPAIVLEADGRDAWGERTPCAEPFALPPDEIAARVAAAGVVGLGGTAFPAAVKLSGAARAGVQTLIINGGECEPYLSCDDRLMRDRAAGIVEGIRLMLRATGAQRALVGIEDNKPEAIAEMQAAVAGWPEIRVCPVPARYPMGSEKQLIQTLTGIEVPAGGLPAEIGVVVHNVGTALAVRAAVVEGQPLISRLVTVNGGAARAPGNIEVRLGTLVEDVLAFAGRVDDAVLARRVLGGPMMGMAVSHWQVPVTKGVSGILALAADEAVAAEAQPCIRCGACIAACPMGLLPLEMRAHVAAGTLSQAAGFGLQDCMACGCCAYVCPAHLPLVQYFAHAKGQLAADGRAAAKLEATKQLAQQKQERLAREAREKAEAAARRKAERAAQAAAATQSEGESA